jgi:hypothetical protein
MAALALAGMPAPALAQASVAGDQEAWNLAMFMRNFPEDP